MKAKPDPCRRQGQAPVSTYSAVFVSLNFAFICAVGDVGMTCSTDAGVTWTNGTTNSVPFNYWQTVFIAGNGDISYAINSGKVLYSFDNGLTWLAVENFPAQQICHVITCDDTGSQVAVSCYSATALSNDSTIYIGTVGGGSSSDSSLSSGQIAGIVIATVLGAVIIIGGIVGYFMYPILFSPKDPVLPSTVVGESPTVVASTSLSAVTTTNNLITNSHATQPMGMNYEKNKLFIYVFCHVD